jgi:hypothetical protein
VWHTVFIVLHAAFGVISFAAGLVAIRSGNLFPVYLWSLVGTIVFLVLPVGAEWNQLEQALRLLFVAFIVLGGFMLWRAAMAARIRPAGPSERTAPYVAHVGFTLVALFDAFIVITVLDMGASGWLVAASGVAFAIAGHFVLREAKRRLVPDGSSTPSTRLR